MNAYLTDSYRKMTVGTDKNQKDAESHMKTAAVIGWIAMAVAIIGGLVYVFTEKSFKGIAYVSIGLVFIVFLIYAIYVSIAAYHMKKGVDYHANKEYYSRLIWILMFSYIIAFAALFFLVHDLMKRHRGSSGYHSVDQSKNRHHGGGSGSGGNMRGRGPEKPSIELQQLESMVLVNRAERYGVTSENIDRAQQTLRLIGESGIWGPPVGGVEPGVL